LQAWTTFSEDDCTTFHLDGNVNNKDFR